MYGLLYVIYGNYDGGNISLCFGDEIKNYIGRFCVAINGFCWFGVVFVMCFYFFFFLLNVAKKADICFVF